MKAKKCIIRAISDVRLMDGNTKFTLGRWQGVRNVLSIKGDVLFNK
jgi:hypothetical protein